MPLFKLANEPKVVKPIQVCQGPQATSQPIKVIERKAEAWAEASAKMVDDDDEELGELLVFKLHSLVSIHVHMHVCIVY